MSNWASSVVALVAFKPNGDALVAFKPNGDVA